MYTVVGFYRHETGFFKDAMQQKGVLVTWLFVVMKMAVSACKKHIVHEHQNMLMWSNNFWKWTAWLGAWCQSSILPWKLPSNRHPNTIYSHLTSVSISKLAPACSSNSATWTWPSWQAAWNGVHPSLGKGMTNMQVSNDTYVRSSRQGFTRLYRKYD